MGELFIWADCSPILAFCCADLPGAAQQQSKIDWPSPAPVRSRIGCRVRFLRTEDGPAGLRRVYLTLVSNHQNNQLVLTIIFYVAQIGCLPFARLRTQVGGKTEALLRLRPFGRRSASPFPRIPRATSVQRSGASSVRTERGYNFVPH